jgi:glycosyltransferase involved in cell wall biosynthesis
MGGPCGGDRTAHTRVSTSTPLLSIIVLTLNSEEFIEECLASIDPQDRRLELLTVDGGSRDATLATVRRTFPHVIVRAAPGTTIPQARNLGLRHAAGSYVLFLDSDERLRADGLGPLLDCLETEAPPFVATHNTRIDRQGNFVGIRLTGYPDPYGGLLRNPVSTLGMVCRRDLLLSLGGFSDAYTVAEDYDLWLRLFEQVRGRKLDVYLAEHRIREDSVSHADPLLMRVYGMKAALAAAKRRRTPRRLRLLLMTYWSLAILGDLGLVPPSGLRALERGRRFSDQLHSQLKNVG